MALTALTAAARTDSDSIALEWERTLELNEVVVVARRPVMKQQEGKLVYIVKNDPYSAGLDSYYLLDRIPRVTATDGTVTVAGKGTVRYIIDGKLVDLDAAALRMRLQDLRAEDIEKIELLATPPARYAVEPNAAYISITTRNESLGTRGSVYGSLNLRDKLREYFSGNISHTTRRIEMSVDANVSNYYTTNDNDMEYIFPENARSSSSRTESHSFNSGVNALFRYKFTPEMKAGVMASYTYENVSSDGVNTTDYGFGQTSASVSATKSRPNNAVTLTGFFDWNFGKRGESLELTYNYFNRHSPSSSRVSTVFDGDYFTGIREDGAADYRFHSGKADFKLPNPVLNLETGVAYTDILNTSDNRMQRFNGSADVVTGTPDDFEYYERIAAAYLSASRDLGRGFWAKLGLRYEYTWSKGVQVTTAEINRRDYGRLFPSANISWNKNGIGSFNLSYSMGMGRPNLWELNPFRYYSTTDEYAAGNPMLKPTIYNNAEINYYGLGGLYAVLYTSFASDAISYIRSFDGNGVLGTLPVNCLSTNKTGLYASYRRNIFDWWEMNAGGEVFHSRSHSDAPELNIKELRDWSGKIEVSANWMLNRQKTLKFGARFTHYFPWEQNMVRYRSFQLFSMTLRYSLLNNRLNLHLTANDIFGWNKTRSMEYYADYTIRHTFNANSEYVLLGVSFNFGRDKVNGVWRASKEEQSSRTK